MGKDVREIAAEIVSAYIRAQGSTPNGNNQTVESTCSPAKIQALYKAIYKTIRECERGIVD